jgi:hypothetical protein
MGQVHQKTVYWWRIVGGKNKRENEASDQRAKLRNIKRGVRLKNIDRADRSQKRYIRILRN